MFEVVFHNELDGEFGYDSGVGVAYTNLTKSEAKSIARHLNKVAPDFMSYWVEEGDEEGDEESDE